MDFSTLQGKTFVKVEVGDDIIRFDDTEGKSYYLGHIQDCCEHVYVESIVGDLSDLVGEPILLAEEATSSEDPAGVVQEYRNDSQTWTFYKLRTIKGSVDIRWLGTSNGYYSESVQLNEGCVPAY